MMVVVMGILVSQLTLSNCCCRSCSLNKSSTCWLPGLLGICKKNISFHCKCNTIEMYTTIQIHTLKCLFRKHNTYQHWGGDCGRIFRRRWGDWCTQARITWLGRRGRRLGFSWGGGDIHRGFPSKFIRGLSCHMFLGVFARLTIVVVILEVL
jgi:hypothetical protein